LEGLPSYAFDKLWKSLNLLIDELLRFSRA